MKVWVVFDEDYYGNGRSIRGVFSSEEIAKAVNGDSIEERIVDEGTDEIRSGLKSWFVEITNSGDVDASEDSHWWGTSPFEGFERREYEYVLAMRLWAKDREDAISQANTKRLSLLQENKWPKPHGVIP